MLSSIIETDADIIAGGFYDIGGNLISRSDTSVILFLNEIELSALQSPLQTEVQNLLAITSPVFDNAGNLIGVEYSPSIS